MPDMSKGSVLQVGGVGEQLTPSPRKGLTVTKPWRRPKPTRRVVAPMKKKKTKNFHSPYPI